jgi:hypothetical protein
VLGDERLKERTEKGLRGTLEGMTEQAEGWIDVRLS